MCLFHRLASLATLAALFLTSASMNASLAAEPDERLYEMRIYYAAEGKLEALHSRFRDHTCKLFEKHGIENIGYWTPIDNPESKLIYFLAYPDQAARDKSWKAFMADPDWVKAYKASEVDGRLVDKVVSKFFKATDYSPKIKPDTRGDRVFELRTYTTTPGNLDALHARFRDHTVKLFAKHGITNVAYWSLTEGQEGADKTLLYIIAHKSTDAAKASFDAFRQDPEWTAARAASEEKAGGSLTEKEGGVLSEFLVPSDYSTIR